jgi:hypothetical protein
VADALEGQTVSTGFFTLDKRMAVEKMREHQLADPHQYVLCLVQAAVALGAKSIGVSVYRNSLTRNTLMLQMEGVILPREIMLDPLGGLFIDQTRSELSGYRNLAVGLNGALSLKSARVGLNSGEMSVTVPEGGALIRHPGDPGDTAVFVLGTQRASLWDLLKLRRSDEENWLRKRAGFCPIPLLVNGARVDEPWTRGSAPYQRGRIEMRLGTQPGMVAFIKHGVVVGARTLKLKTPSANAVVRADDILVNLGGTDIVEDEIYTAILSELDLTCDGWLNTVCDSYAGSVAPDTLRRVILQALSDSIRTPRTLSARVFRTTDGRWLDVKTLENHVSKHGCLAYWHAAREELPPHLIMEGHGGMVLHSIDSWEETALRNLFRKKLRKVKQAVAQEEVNQRTLIQRYAPNTRHRAQRYSIPTLGDEAQYISRFAVHSGGFRGEFGIPLPVSKKATIRFYKKGRYLTDRNWADQPVGFELAINHQELVEELSGSGIVEEDVYRSALQLATRLVTQACADLARSTIPLDSEDPYATHLLWCWLEGRRGGFDQAPEAIRRYPLFPTVAGVTACLDDLLADKVQYGCVFYAPNATPGFQADHRHIVCDPLAVDVLRRLFPSAVDYSYGLREERSRVTGAPTREALAHTLHPVVFTLPGATGVVGVSMGARSLVRLLASGRPVRTQDLALGFGPIEAIVDMPGDTTRLPEVVSAGCLVLALEVARHWGDPVHPLLRAFMQGFLAWKAPDIPDELLDVPLFDGLNGTRLSIRTLQGEDALHWVPVDTKPGPQPEPIVVAGTEEARLAARLAGIQRVTSYEQTLSRRRNLASYLQRPVASRDVHPAAFHVVDVPGARIGFRHPTPSFRGQSPVRVIHEDRLLDTLMIDTPVPADIITWASSLNPTADYRTVRSDEAWQAMRRRLVQDIGDAIEHLPPEGTDTRLLWALSCATGPAALLHAADPPLSRLVDLPQLIDSEDRPMSLREVARQAVARGVCVWGERGGFGKHRDPACRMVRLTFLQQAWMAQVFAMQDGTTDLAPPPPSGPSPSSVILTVPTLWRVPIEGGGELGISQDGQAGVQRVVDGQLVESNPRFGDLPVVGIVTGREEATLEGALDALYAQVDDLPRLIPYFRYRHEQLATVPAARKPLFKTNRGDAMSLVDVISTPGIVWYSMWRNESSARLLYLDGPTRDFLQDILGDRLQRAGLELGRARLQVPVAVPEVPLPRWRRWWQEARRWRRWFSPTRSEVEPLGAGVAELLAEGGWPLRVALAEGGPLLSLQDTVLLLNMWDPSVRRLILHPSGPRLLAATAMGTLRRSGLATTDQELAFLRHLSKC